MSANNKKKTGMSAEPLFDEGREQGRAKVRRVGSQPDSSSKESELDAEEAKAAGLKSAVRSASKSDGKLDAVKEQLNDVMQHLTENAELMREHTMAIQEQTRQQEIQFAMQNLKELTAFTYYSEESTYNSSQTKLIKNILWSFLKGTGFLLPNKATLEDPYFCRGNVQAMEVLEVRFREKVVKDLSAILCSRPQISREENGRYRVSYE